eukprot:4038817-Amphidinium_carterae.1
MQAAQKEESQGVTYWLHCCGPGETVRVATLPMVATGVIFPLASEQSDQAPGKTGDLSGAPTGRTVEPAPDLPVQPAVRRTWPIFRHSQREPD